MIRKTVYLVFVALFIFSNYVFSQTTLGVGDIAFVALNADGTDDEFSFVLLKPISGGTQINFTDCGWTDGVGFTTSSGDAGYFTWTATSPMAVGDVVTIKTYNGNNDATASSGTISGTRMLISIVGDQIFAFQGSFNLSANFISAIHYNVYSGVTNEANWDGSVVAGYENSTSALPDQLTNGVNALWVYAPGPTENDNFIYNGSVNSGDIATIRSAVNNVNNWLKDNNTPYTQQPFPVTFNVVSCTNPDIPTVSASSSSVCSGSTAALSISGNLNDATSWHVYTGSCGGTEIGTTATSTFLVSPGSATTYYVRGEGGCTTPGSCGTTTILIKANTTISAQPAASTIACSGDPDNTLSVTASGGGTLSYQWYNSGGAISGAGSSSLSITSLPSNSDTYYCTVTGDCGSVTSNNALVKINPAYITAETKAVCPGSGYTFPDGAIQNNITSQIVHTSNLVTKAGCDSVITTTVNVLPVYDLSETRTVCSGSGYTFPDGTTQNNIISQVMHTSNLVTKAGCDSVITTTINVLPVYDLSETRTVCSGSGYTFPDGTTQNNIISQVEHTSNLVTKAGCDSVITTTVNVLPVYDLSETKTVCSGSDYVFPDGTTQNDITSQAMHKSNLVTKAGCDSVITTTVNVLMAYDLSETKNVCSGSGYTFPDGTTQNNITSQVVYTSSLVTKAGCDSVITTTVNAIEVDKTVVQSGSTITSNATNVSYQWLDCNNDYKKITGEVSQSFSTSAGGNYAVEITDNGCVDTSACYSISVTGIVDSDSEERFLVYPNPGEGDFSLNLHSVHSLVTITILDAYGKLIESETYQDRQFLNIKIKEPAGIYFLIVDLNGTKTTLKLIKK